LTTDTKQKITETALKLFNNSGSYAVTTRHIATEMNISPGNLYYHYRNKEEIIRVLLEGMVEDFNLFIRPASFSPNLIEQFNDTISHTGKVMHKYRFFFMELYTLLEKDPILKKMYMRIKQERVSDFKAIYKFLEQAGLIEEPLSDEEFSIINENAWTLAEFLLQSMYMNRIKITPENIVKKFSHVMYMVRPYLKKEFRDFIK
jgi:AcrR family transcriptional regulator